jgi:2-amino-4-hydroxy-6-hydroxymethyldihydropteridine diphosphokinase
LIPLPNLALIALGSNLGDSRNHVREAIDELRELSAEPLLVSSLWETSPVDCPPGSPAFVNAVVGLLPRPGQDPEALFAFLQSIEKKFGRKPKVVLNEPRPLDLDLIAFGHQTCQSKNLILPHPRAHQRRFVLQPLSEIAPNLVLPAQTKTVLELLNLLPPDRAMRRIPRSESKR